MAAVAGVSRQTVSRVLNDPDAVRAETAERVRRAVADLGYEPDPSARMLGRRPRGGAVAARRD
ncbi:LacI family DNA-binding transcriptional regulator [Curtobacterium pusillum]|uniref:LacI family DNA-binding transcriptional regulator n=1 Tax=Curtobacterium pusillum TaxID=69373 RepID=UPI0037BEAE19